MKRDTGCQSATKSGWVSPKLIDLGGAADVLTGIAGEDDGEGANMSSSSAPTS